MVWQVRAGSARFVRFWCCSVRSGMVWQARSGSFCSGMARFAVVWCCAVLYGRLGEFRFCQLSYGGVVFGMAGKVRRGKLLWGRLFVGPCMERQGIAGLARSRVAGYGTVRFVEAGKASLGKFWSCGVRQAWLGPFSYGSAHYGLAWQARYCTVRLGLSWLDMVRLVRNQSGKETI